uniref:Uncharacterized protein n=1 Tax=Siphoviridae sp. ctDsE1 TaxID=2825390 RepID=A0A8S5TYH5_9CAUD|nr:MAG TPA: hypothetical protein [Siphoviridae sp. ctDsE1]
MQYEEPAQCVNPVMAAPPRLDAALNVTAGVSAIWITERSWMAPAPPEPRNEKPGTSIMPAENLP